MVVVAAAAAVAVCVCARRYQSLCSIISGTGTPSPATSPATPSGVASRPSLSPFAAPGRFTFFATSQVMRRCLLTQCAARSRASGTQAWGVALKEQASFEGKLRVSTCAMLPHGPARVNVKVGAPRSICGAHQCRAHMQMISHRATYAWLACVSGARAQ